MKILMIIAFFVLNISNLFACSFESAPGTTLEGIIKENLQTDHLIILGKVVSCQKETLCTVKILKKYKGELKGDSISYGRDLRPNEAPTSCDIFLRKRHIGEKVILFLGKPREGHYMASIASRSQFVPGDEFNEVKKILDRLSDKTDGLSNKHFELLLEYTNMYRNIVLDYCKKSFLKTNKKIKSLSEAQLVAESILIENDKFGEYIDNCIKSISQTSCDQNIKKGFENICRTKKELDQLKKVIKDTRSIADKLKSKKN